MRHNPGCTRLHREIHEARNIRALALHLVEDEVIVDGAPRLQPNAILVPSQRRVVVVSCGAESMAPKFGATFCLGWVS